MDHLFGAYHDVTFQTLIIIIAAAVFLLVQAVSKLHKAPAPPPPSTKPCPYCATDIPLEAKRCPNCTSQLAA